MREIKFRAWERELKEIIPVTDIVFDTQVINSNGAWRRFGEIDLMQYTGLKDKNGKEIYEGDILATANDGADGADTWEQEILGDVYWNEKFACWNHRADLHDDDSIYNLNKYVYVVGNIYENPELLK